MIMGKRQSYMLLTLLQYDPTPTQRRASLLLSPLATVCSLNPPTPHCLLAPLPLLMLDSFFSATGHSLHSLWSLPGAPERGTAEYTDRSNSVRDIHIEKHTEGRKRGAGDAIRTVVSIPRKPLSSFLCTPGPFRAKSSLFLFFFFAWLVRKGDCFWMTVGCG